MARNPHPYESVAQELLGWIDSESTWAADALRGGHTAPFGADITEREKRDYYARQMFQVAPNGDIQYDKPNAQGRDTLMKQLGVSGYSKVWEEIRPKQGRRPTPESNEPDLDQDEMGDEGL